MEVAITLLDHRTGLDEWPVPELIDKFKVFDLFLIHVDHALINVLKNVAIQGVTTTTLGSDISDGLAIVCPFVWTRVRAKSFIA